MVRTAIRKPVRALYCQCPDWGEAEPVVDLVVGTFCKLRKCY